MIQPYLLGMTTVAIPGRDLSRQCLGLTCFLYMSLHCSTGHAGKVAALHLSVSGEYSLSRCAVGL